MYRICTIGLLFVVAGCRDKYQADLKAGDKALLVVEGSLNPGLGATIIRLTQTAALQDPVMIRPLLSAVVSVEGENGDTFTLPPIGNGYYQHNQLPLLIGEHYRLRIKTGGGKEYLSDPVEARPTPEIDTVTWKKDARGITFYVDTHDPSNNTRYYKWSFDETWEIRSFYAAEFEWTGGSTIIASPFYRYACWKNSISTILNVGTSAQLASDVISQAPIHFIPIGNEKLSFRYSMLLKQQALSKAAYEYYQLLKKNTESIGTIFDPQPSELRGNIKCISDPAEPVIGFITASATTEKRMFVTSVQADWNYPQDCPAVKVLNKPDSITKWVPHYLPWAAQYFPSGAIEAYYMAPADCVDCTLRGGSLAKPSYW